MKRIKVILDFDGTLTDEVKQAEELAGIAKKILAEEILGVELAEIEGLYNEKREEILSEPHKYHWEVNGLHATYAYEGAYLLNTSILQNIIKSKQEYLKKVKKLFPATGLDPVTRCSNHLFHTGSLKVKPHFLKGARKFLISLIKHETIEPVILTNSETRKIEKNLCDLGIGNCDSEHTFKHEIGILGDTRQYHMDKNWKKNFKCPVNGFVCRLPINKHFSVDLRRPIYYKALKKVQREGHDEIVVVADGFSLAGAMPLLMGLRFILKKTPNTPNWVEEYVEKHPKGAVAENLNGLNNCILSLV